MRTKTLAVLACLYLLWCAGAAKLSADAKPAPAAKPVDFATQVQPIFEKSCTGCHGAATQTSGLRLDIGVYALRGGNSGPVIVPGRSAQSRLFLLVAGHVPGKIMPARGPRLAPEQVEIVRRWIDEGANWPNPNAAPVATSKGSRHWAYQPIRRPALPKIKNGTWAKNPIDLFVLARLEQAKLTPAPEADRTTLIRRLSLDLIGLPPTPSEVDAFWADRSPNAYGKLVDRLLASPHYGEHWARRWLDLARYADTNGYEKDNPRVMWKWRDWVIAALNSDMPYDRFTVEQLAGDLLPDATLDQRIATGFHRNTMINEEGGVDQEQFRWEAVHDRVGTTGTVWLGQTIACARCHDHKYDPISQKEYYRFAAILNDADEPTVEVAAPWEMKKRDAVRGQIAALEAERKAHAGDPPERLQVMDKRIADLKTAEPKISTALVLAGRAEPRVTNILVGGDFQLKGEAVTPGVPAVLPPLPKGVKPDRLALARWLVNGKNPLVARVAVNRAWESFFGRGLMNTPEDWGVRAARPSHPELLDWLAGEFMAPKAGRAWSQKALHRRIVTSAAYRQSSRVSPGLHKRDPANTLLARGPRFRVEAETVRDIALAASGLLTNRVGGPSVFPPQPEGVAAQSYGPTPWNTETGPNRTRRGLYTFLKRTAPYPALILFDAPTADVTCPRRVRSNTPLQSLVTLNDTAFVEAAQALARRVTREVPDGEPEKRLRRAFRLCVSRTPDPSEGKRLLTLYEKQLRRFRAEPERAALVALADPTKPPKDADMPALAAWTVVSRILLNLDETLTKE